MVALSVTELNRAKMVKQKLFALMILKLKFQVHRMQIFSMFLFLKTINYIDIFSGKRFSFEWRFVFSRMFYYRSTLLRGHLWYVGAT